MCGVIGALLIRGHSRRHLLSEFLLNEFQKLQNMQAYMTYFTDERIDKGVRKTGGPYLIVRPDYNDKEIQLKYVAMDQEEWDRANEAGVFQ